MSKCYTYIVLPPKTIVLKDVQLPSHLTEDKYPAALFLQFGQQFVQDNHFAAVVHKVLISCVRWTRLSTVKEIRVVAALAQLHEDVLQAHFLHFAGTVDDINVLHENFSVPEIIKLSFNPGQRFI
jgi:hypothetical protein